MLRRCLAFVVAGAVAPLSACSPDIDTPSPTGDDARACRQLVDDLPDSVGAEERGDDVGDFVATYGDPRIVLRCGVDRPAELMTNCIAVNGVDWYAPDEQQEDTSVDVTAITVGRRPNVELLIPARYRPLDDELVDVSAVVAAHTEAEEPC